MLLKEQKFGVEIELTGITRADASKTIAELFGTNPSRDSGGCYHTRNISDSKGRVWKVMRDSSIQPEPCGDEYKVEVVTPILTYEDIELVQSVIRALRKNGAKANGSCGIHIHVDGANHNAKSLKNIVNFMCSRQDLIYEALEVKNSRETYCKKICPSLLNKIKKLPTLDIPSIESAWYSNANDDYSGGTSREHYNSTRYHCLNLHSYFYRGTVEFRLFNSTTHAGELKAYIQFCLAASAWAIESTDKIVFRGTQSYTPEQKVTLMINVLTKRLWLTGAEFKTCRIHLTKSLEKAVGLAA